MSDGFILDTPDQIQAFALLQIYFKLKMEVGLPNGPTWRGSPSKQAKAILEANGIPCNKRRKADVLAAYKTFLEDNGILKERV